MSPSPPEAAPRRRLSVAVLGATGAVGQAFVRLLADHPWLELTAVAASEQSAGKRYGDLVRWREPVPLPDPAAKLILQPRAPPPPPSRAPRRSTRPSSSPRSTPRWRARRSRRSRGRAPWW